MNQAEGKLATAVKYQQQLLRQLEAAAAAMEAEQNVLDVSKDRLLRHLPVAKDDSASVECVVELLYAARCDEAALQEARSHYERIFAKLGPSDEPFGQIMAAKAKLDQAKFYLAKTLVRASGSGRVTNFYLRPGQYVGVGTEMFAIVDTACWWATARFKDVVLGNIHRGAPAKVWVDMYWSTLFDGYVEGIGWGVNRHQASPMVTKSALPFLEQTEFWIRLAQRFRVRVAITDPRARDALRIGANCRVFIRKRREESRAEWMIGSVTRLERH